MTNFHIMFEDNRESIIDAVMERILEVNPFYKSLTREELSQRVLLSLEPYARDLDEPEPHYFATFWHSTALQRAEQGMPLSAFLQTLIVGSEEMLRGLRRACGDDLARQLAIIEHGFMVTASGIAALYQGYAEHKDAIIQAQQSTIAEVSLPLVPVHSGILVMPLIGVIDARRAVQVMEGVLIGISEHQAEVVILDITGMSMVDTSVAQHLIQVTRAAQMLGATMVLVGIRSEIAQTIVGLGVDLSNMVTLANLQEGIAYALGTQGLAITPVR